MPGAPERVPAVESRVGRFIVLSRERSCEDVEVCDAYDPLLDRRVRLVAMPEGSERSAALVRQAKGLASLRHPALVRILSIDVHRGLVIVASEIVRGEPFAVAARGSIERFARLVTSIVGALAELERAGLDAPSIDAASCVVGQGDTPKLRGFGALSFGSFDASPRSPAAALTSVGALILERLSEGSSAKSTFSQRRLARFLTDAAARMATGHYRTAAEAYDALRAVTPRRRTAALHQASLRIAAAVLAGVLAATAFLRVALGVWFDGYAVAFALSAVSAATTIAFVPAVRDGLDIDLDLPGARVLGAIATGVLASFAALLGAWLSAEPIVVAERAELILFAMPLLSLPILHKRTFVLSAAVGAGACAVAIAGAAPPMLALGTLATSSLLQLVFDRPGEPNQARARRRA